MPVLQLDDRQFPLHVGATRVGAGADVDVALPGVEPGLHAVLDVAPEGRTAIRRMDPEAPVRVNGVALGAEPTPLLHGDKVEIAGRSMVFVEDDKAGATRYVSASEVAALASRKGGGRATKASGGRLISLLDGKEYQVPSTGLMIGRDASCQVVVPQTEVSRHHAEIIASDAGYLLRDLSTNGVLVNGTRISGSQLLSRADVVRVGSEDFRFYADVPTPAIDLPAVPASARSATEAPAEARARHSHPAPVTTPETVRERGLPIWVWALAAVLIGAGAYFVLQGR
jgi:hypothetical protein